MTTETDLSALSLVDLARDLSLCEGDKYREVSQAIRAELRRRDEERKSMDRLIDVGRQIERHSIRGSQAWHMAVDDMIALRSALAAFKVKP